LLTYAMDSADPMRVPCERPSTMSLRGAQPSTRP